MNRTGSASPESSSTVVILRPRARGAPGTVSRCIPCLKDSSWTGCRKTWNETKHLKKTKFDWTLSRKTFQTIWFPKTKRLLPRKSGIYKTFLYICSPYPVLVPCTMQVFTASHGPPYFPFQKLKTDAYLAFKKVFPSNKAKCDTWVVFFLVRENQVGFRFPKALLGLRNFLHVFVPTVVLTLLHFVSTPNS